MSTRSSFSAGASTSSPEAIALNLQRALKQGGLSKTDLCNALQCQKAMAALEPDPKLVARILLTEKSISENGVPPYEIARVLGDGVKSKELFAKLAADALAAMDVEGLKDKDVESFVGIYEQLGIKGNIPHDVISHIDRSSLIVGV